MKKCPVIYSCFVAPKLPLFLRWIRVSVCPLNILVALVDYRCAFVVKYTPYFEEFFNHKGHEGNPQGTQGMAAEVELITRQYLTSNN